MIWGRLRLISFGWHYAGSIIKKYFLFSEWCIEIEIRCYDMEEATPHQYQAVLCWASRAIGSIYFIPTDVIRCSYHPQWNRLSNQLDNPMLTRKRHQLNQIIIGYF